MSIKNHMIASDSLDHLFYTYQDGATIKKYSDGDLERIGMIKLNTDIVYAYFARMLDDHRIATDTALHDDLVKKTFDDLMMSMALPPERQELAKYFVANVLKSAQEFELLTLRDRAWLPFRDEDLLMFYDQKLIVSLLSDLSVQNACAFAGVFVSQETNAHSKYDSIKEGSLVGCDLLFVQLLKAKDLIAMADEEVKEEAVSNLFLTVGSLVTAAPGEVAK